MSIINQLVLESYRTRSNIQPGTNVSIVLKKDQGTDKRVTGIVKRILTSKSYHSRGIKVMLTDGQVGRVQKVLDQNDSTSEPVQLGRMDENFLKSIKDYKNILYSPSKDNHYYTIIYNNNKAGVVGVIKNTFLQIVIHPSYRGKGLLKLASDLVAKKHNIKILYATIDQDNNISINDHKKAGFKMFPKEEIDNLIKNGKLYFDQIRMYKEY